MTSPTNRPISRALEFRIGKPVKLLDHGFMTVLDYMGNDQAILDAARTSYGKGTKKTSNDAGLLNYLMRHRHTTPFEMCEIKFHFKMPIFVARQWVRHRTANVNEYSGRYSIMDREFYVPEIDQLAIQSKTNMQGRGEVLGQADAERVMGLIKDDAGRSFDAYDGLLEDNLARELARIGLPLSTYTQFTWKIDLHNLLHFLSLRADPHAQYEIRVFADAIMEVVRDWCPDSYAAFVEHRMEAFTLSSSMVDALREVFCGVALPDDLAARHGIGKRDYGDMVKALVGEREGAA